MTSEKLPTRRATTIFATKVTLLRLKRGVAELGRAPPRLTPDASAPGGSVAGESRTPLWSDPLAAERRYQLGKVQNLRRAARAFDGLIIPAGAVFSFWRQLGRASRRRGFVDGRMLQGGCMVPAIGGGLCQLSNALHDVALQAGCTIVERHAHSRQVPGSAMQAGRDATVAWNYVDLRFQPDRDLQLRVQLTRDELVVHLSSSPVTTLLATVSEAERHPTMARSCADCAQTSCFRHETGPVAVGRRAFLLDELWPEFIDHLGTVMAQDAWLGLPFPDRLPAAFRRGGAQPIGARIAAIRRSLTMRLADPGAMTRRAAAAGAAGIAKHLATRLPADATNLVIAQSFLPYLWRDGHLGGRRFSVLMTRPPMHVIQRRLSDAHILHPDRVTLADFRADPALVEWEAEALAAADQLITPHADVAALFPGRSRHLPWHRPAPAVPTNPCRTMSRRIAFPGPTLARKGAFEIRDAARSLDLEVVLTGAELEGSDFWAGVKVMRPDPARSADAWLADVAAVVQPALVEEQPRRLLVALTAGVPVLATPACGLDYPGIIGIAPLDSANLIMKLRQLIEPCAPSGGRSDAR